MTGRGMSSPKMKKQNNGTTADLGYGMDENVTDKKKSLTKALRIDVTTDGITDGQGLL